MRSAATLAAAVAAYAIRLVQSSSTAPTPSRVGCSLHEDLQAAECAAPFFNIFLPNLLPNATREQLLIYLAASETMRECLRSLPCTAGSKLDRTTEIIHNMVHYFANDVANCTSQLEVSAIAPCTRRLTLWQLLQTRFDGCHRYRKLVFCLGREVKAVCGEDEWETLKSLFLEYARAVNRECAVLVLSNDPSPSMNRTLT